MSGRDIVERLRDGAPCDIGRRGACVPSCVWCEAAAEIERLRAALLAGREWLEIVSPPPPQSASGVRMAEFKRHVVDVLPYAADRPACWVTREFSLSSVPGLHGGTHVGWRPYSDADGGE